MNVRSRIGICSVFALLLASSVFIASCDRLPTKAELAEQQKREAVYQAAVDAYAKVIKPGMTRKNVEDYFRRERIQFQQMCCVAQESSWTDLVKIGTDRKPWYCSAHNVYAAFQFAAVEGHDKFTAFDSDELKTITVFHWLEGCL